MMLYLPTTTIGTCSLCGGPVQEPRAWWGTKDPIATCANCGATRADRYGPVVPMVQPDRPTGAAPIADAAGYHTADDWGAISW